MKKFIPIFVLLLLVMSCSDIGGKEEVACLCAGPESIALEVVQNNSNVFDTEIFSLEDIFLTGEDSQGLALSIEPWDFSSNGSDIRSILILQNENWQARDYNFNLNVSSDYAFPVNAEVELSEGECCGGIPFFQSLEFNGMTQERTGGVITLILE